MLHILGSADLDGTGVARIVGGLARGIDKKRFQLHACFLGADGALVQYLQYSGASARAVRLHENVLGSVRFLCLLREITPQIVHQHAGGPKLSRLARWATGAKILVHVHGTIEESSLRHAGEIRLHVADAVIANSESTARLVVGVRADVVHAGVDTEDASNGGRQGPGLVIGTAGRLVEVKGHVYLLRAFAQLLDEFPNASLEICGDGPNRKQLEADAQRLHCSHAVRFLGWRYDYPRLARSWDLFVLPSLEESFGIALLEAMSMGLSSVASRVGGIPELVEDGVTAWLVPPRDVSALAARMRQLLVDSDDRTRMGNAARQRARDRFPSRLMVARIEAVYDSLLGQTARGSPPGTSPTACRHG